MRVCPAAAGGRSRAEGGTSAYQARAKSERGTNVARRSLYAHHRSKRRAFISPTQPIIVNSRSSSVEGEGAGLQQRHRRRLLRLRRRLLLLLLLLWLRRLMVMMRLEERLRLRLRLLSVLGHRRKLNRRLLRRQHGEGPVGEQHVLRLLLLLLLLRQVLLRHKLPVLECRTELNELWLRCCEHLLLWRGVHHLWHLLRVELLLGGEGGGASARRRRVLLPIRRGTAAGTDAAAAPVLDVVGAPLVAVGRSRRRRIRRADDNAGAGEAVGARLGRRRRGVGGDERPDDLVERRRRAVRRRARLGRVGDEHRR
mmetsp:Transcript_55088/g.169728  ORF Transcript_55088/g.169728 Transcript_55088/m.169728 type:complete len:311 (-) Transcript_55088:730-1662(-)